MRIGAARPRVVAPRAARGIPAIGPWLALIAGLIGLVALIGWALDVERLRQVIPGSPEMRFNSSLCVAVLALAWWVPRVPRLVVSAFVALVAVTTLIEYVFDIPSGIDELVVAAHSRGEHPGRMAVATALSLLALAGARMLIDVCRPYLAQACATAVVIVQVLTLIGYAYEVPLVRDIRPVPTQAGHTAFALLLLGAAVLAAVPGGALNWWVHGQDAGAMLTRRLLPVALVGLPVVGGLALLGERRGLYGSTAAIAIVVVVCAFIVAGVSWLAALGLVRTEHRRARAMAELTALKIDLERQVHDRAAMLQRRRNEIAVLEDRQRIAADLHDIVIQRLFAAGMFLQGTGPLTSDPDTRYRVDAAVEAMDAAIKDLRASIFELGARREAPTDLTTAIDDVCLESARVLGFIPDVIVDDPHLLADRVRDDILAVVREALANVARHAHATHVEVELRCLAGRVVLTITDDGRGMSEAAHRSGTRNMAERARVHGGDCTWSAARPHGTVVHWELPIPQPVRS